MGCLEEALQSKKLGGGAGIHIFLSSALLLLSVRLNLKLNFIPFDYFRHCGACPEYSLAKGFTFNFLL